MADMLLCDHLEELWMLIDQQHLLYLISDDSAGKLDQREKLESYIKEYLYVAPHNKKFSFPQTAQVLHRSASDNANFSGHKAALAWKAIGKYADNLVVQPWRKEFKDLKLYCGFYKHEVEENLTDAELMFEAMGYCYAGNSTMTITDILDPDRITSVSKDAIVAYVECQILKQIWENLSPHYNFTWLEILEFRENHTGTADQAIRTLRYKRRQRQYEEQMYRRAQYQAAAESHPRPEYAYGSNLPYLNHMHYPGHTYQYPVQPRFGSVPHLVSPSSVYPPIYGAQSAIKPHDFYPPNGYHVHQHYPPMQDAYPNYHQIHPQQPSVPTAQLIELDSAPVQNSERPRYPEGDVASKWPEEKNESSFPSGKAKDDGAGSWENWDYVYKNLGSQGYKKNVSSRGDVTAPKSNRNSDSEGKVQGELVEKIKKLNVGGKETKDVEEEPKARSRKESPREAEPDRGGRSSPEKKVTSPAKVNNNQKEVDSQTDSGKKWQCISCTYLNPSDKNICEVCCKSKERGAESDPQPTGGQECQNCTLVNERGMNFCAACSEPLKGAPTYI
ncbi:UNVERIFIED_CONTAM: hypothetical protein PYX00_000899 [Menopon gallinae]|uniref:RanBP2-type domain-containing protein n=1 Tax=Menopon gallinae TaxID=328185 RepID=A0AAW2ICW4_9NEOP